MGQRCLNEDEEDGAGGEHHQRHNDHQQHHINGKVANNGAVSGLPPVPPQQQNGVGAQPLDDDGDLIKIKLQSATFTGKLGFRLDDQLRVSSVSIMYRIILLL